MRVNSCFNSSAEARARPGCTSVRVRAWGALGSALAVLCGVAVTLCVLCEFVGDCLFTHEEADLQHTRLSFTRPCGGFLCFCRTDRIILQKNARNLGALMMKALQHQHSGGGAALG